MTKPDLPGFTVHTTFDIANVPEREWLVPDIIPAGRFGLLTDDEGGGTGKSRLAIQLCAALAAGERDWLPGSGVQLDGKPRSVVYANYQDEYTEVARRVRDIGYADDVFNGRFMTVNNPGTLWDGGSTANLDHLKSICAERKAELLVIDPFPSSCAGWSDFHLAPVKEFFLHLDRWGEESGTAVAMVMGWEFGDSVFRPRWQLRLRTKGLRSSSPKRTGTGVALVVDSTYGNIVHHEDDPQWWFAQAPGRIAIVDKQTAIAEATA